MPTSRDIATIKDTWGDELAIRHPHCGLVSLFCSVEPTTLGFIMNREQLVALMEACRQAIVEIDEGR